MTSDYRQHYNRRSRVMTVYDALIFDLELINVDINAILSFICDFKVTDKRCDDFINIYTSCQPLESLF